MNPLRLLKVPKLSNRERFLTAGVLLTISVLLLDQVVLGPWWRHVQSVREEINRLEESIRSYQQILNRKPEVMDQVETFSTHLRHTGSEPIDVGALLREIEALGKESEIRLGEVKPLVLEGGEFQQAYALEIHTTGSLEQWIQFVHRIQSSKSLFQIERAQLSFKEEGSDLLEGSLRVRCEILQSPQSP